MVGSCVKSQTLLKKMTACVIVVNKTILKFFRCLCERGFVFVKGRTRNKTSHKEFKCKAEGKMSL